MSILNAEKLLLFGIRQNGELSGLKILYGERIYIFGLMKMIGNVKLSATFLTIKSY